VVADGTSCRHQIRDGIGREALHAARLLERLLLEGGAQGLDHVDYRRLVERGHDVSAADACDLAQSP
jgi:hypothetical protein